MVLIDIQGSLLYCKVGSRGYQGHVKYGIISFRNNDTTRWLKYRGNHSRWCMIPKLLLLLLTCRHAHFKDCDSPMHIGHFQHRCHGSSTDWTLPNHPQLSVLNKISTLVAVPWWAKTIATRLTSTMSKWTWKKTQQKREKPAHPFGRPRNNCTRKKIRP